MAITFLTSEDKVELLKLIEEAEGGCITGSGAPSTSTKGEVGDFYMDTLTGAVYKCTTINEGVYTWMTLSVADPAGTASDAVSAHNTSDAAHDDIRLLITGLTNRLNALANSTDEDLDQLAEIVAYIKANKSLIDSITTNKVNVADIIDNLTTSVSNKPLSAKMGVELKKLIDAIKIPTSLPASDVYSWAKQPQKPSYTPEEIGAQPAGNYALVTDIPNVPVKSVNGKTGAVQLSASDVGAVTTEQLDRLSEEIADLEKNPLKGRKVSLLGDSICMGADTDVSYLGGYGKIIADRNEMMYENLAQGGATVTAETYTSTTGIAKSWLCRMVDSMSADADYAIIEGGLNDACQWRDHGTITIGAITDGYNAVLDDTTFYGAFESMLKKLVTKFQGKKIGYIATPKTMEYWDSSRNVPNFYHMALECCAKWGVPVCDLNTIAPPFSLLGSEYTADGAHPTYEGYIKYYCDPIEAWMKSLTTGGNNAASTAIKAIEDYTKGFNDAIKALQDGKLDSAGISFRKALLPLADGTTIEIDVLTAIDGTVVIPYINQIPLSIDTDRTVYGNDYNGDGANDGYLKGYRLSSSGVPKALEPSWVSGFIPVKSGDIVRIYHANWGGGKTATNYICAYDGGFNFIGANATISGDTTKLNAYTADVYVPSESDVADADVTIKLATLANLAYIRVSAGEVNASSDPTQAIITINEEIT